MKLETFFEKFDQFAEAPNAVAKMRVLIVQLAVQGKLVPNNAEESPVSLEMTEDASNNTPIPANWRRGILGDVIQLEYGDNLPAPKRTQTGEYPVYGSNGIVGTHDAYLIKEPAIIVGRKGSAGALNIATGPSWTTDVAYFARPPSDLDLRFAYYLLSSLHLDELGKGIKPGLSRKEAYALPVTLPPLAEQKRIVAKVDELMAMCDRLEKQQQERDTRHAALAHASLSRFADSPTPANLNLLFHPSYAIPLADLRKTILTLAVQGKLVPQITDENTLSVPSSPNNKTHQKMINLPNLPNGWSSAPLAMVAAEIVDCPHSTPKWTEHGKICVRTSQFRPGCLDLSAPRYVDQETFNERIQRLRPQENDILYSREGGILGVACRVPQKVNLCLGQRMMLIRSGEKMFPPFLELTLNSPLIRDIALRETTGGAAPRVNVATVKAYPIPIPPLAEQRHIVAKVDQLMTLVDQLETQLTASRSAANKLMEAAVAELTAQE